jgi:cytochrome c oxidase subunit II
MTSLLIAGIVLLLISIVFQISKTSEMVSVLKGAEQSRKDSNKVIGMIFIGFMIVFFTGIFWSTAYFLPSFLPESASVHGVWIDNIFNLTLLVTGTVFIITHIALFIFVYIYREQDGRKAFFYPENHKLEMLWTIIPAIFMTCLVVTGIFYWYKITGDAPKDAMVIEVTGKQFNWIARYAGKDGKLGKRDFTKISDNNIIGMDWKDTANLDDVMPTELHFVVGQPTKIVIRSRDVMHNFDLPHFRVKMDAVPGIPTTFWFIPKYTTEEMRKITKNPKFNYELACAQICGQSHYAMKMAVKVETREEFNKWMGDQKPYYETVQPAAPVVSETAPTEVMAKEEKTISSKKTASIN